MAHTATTPNSENPRLSLSLQTMIDARFDVIRRHNSSPIGRSDFPGQRTGTRRGQGLEFIDLRQYNPSDDVRHIDWNVTARSNQPYTRLYREEREHITTVVVDLRPLMFTGSNRLRSVSAGENAARVLWQANESGDRCAAIVIHAFGIEQSRPIAGTKGVLRALELIASGFSASQQLIDGSARGRRPVSTLLSDVLKLINQARGRSGSYFYISGFDTEDDKNWSDTLAVTAVTGKLKSVLLLDPIERGGLPLGSYPYRVQKEKLTTRVNNSNQQQLNYQLGIRVAQRQALFNQARVPLLTITTELSGADFLTEIVRQRLL